MASFINNTIIIPFFYSCHNSSTKWPFSLHQLHGVFVLCLQKGGKSDKKTRLNIIIFSIIFSISATTVLALTHFAKPSDTLITERHICDEVLPAWFNYCQHGVSIMLDESLDHLHTYCPRRKMSCCILQKSYRMKVDSRQQVKAHNVLEVWLIAHLDIVTVRKHIKLLEKWKCGWSNNYLQQGGCVTADAYPSVWLATKELEMFGF